MRIRLAFQLVSKIPRGGFDKNGLGKSSSHRCGSSIDGRDCNIVSSLRDVVLIVIDHGIKWDYEGVGWGCQLGRTAQRDS